MLAKTETTKLKFPKTVAAVSAVEAHLVKIEQGLWDIAIAVRTECGPRAKPGVNNGSKAKIDECARVLADAGYDYAPITLRKMRDTADAFLFPADSRLSGVKFWVHEAAGDPDTLVEAKKDADKHGVTLSEGFVKKFKDRRKRDALSAALRAKDDAVCLIADTCAALEHLAPHIPRLTDFDKAEVQEALDRLISLATDMTDALTGEPWKEAAE